MSSFRATTTSENVLFFFQVTQPIRGVAPPRSIQPFPRFAGVSRVSRVNRRRCRGRPVPTHGPSGAALIYGSGAEPGRKGGAPSTLPRRDAEGCPSASLQSQPPPGYHPPAARQPPKENGFAGVSSGRGHEGPDWGLRTIDIPPLPVLEAGHLRSRGPRAELCPESPGKGPTRLFQLMRAPGVCPWAGGRLPPVSASVSTWLLLCVCLFCVLRTLTLG